MVVSLIVILYIARSKKSFSSKSYSFSQRFIVQAWCCPLKIVFDCVNYFHPSGQFRCLFSLILRSHHLRIIHSSFQLSLSKSYECIVQVFSNQFGISSFTCIWIPSSIFICSLILTGDYSLYFVHFQFLWRFVQDFSSFFIILIYPLFQSYRWFIEDLPKLRYFSLQSFQEE